MPTRLSADPRITQRIVSNVRLLRAAPKRQARGSETPAAADRPMEPGRARIQLYPTREEAEARAQDVLPTQHVRIRLYPTEAEAAGEGPPEGLWKFLTKPPPPKGIGAGYPPR